MLGVYIHPDERAPTFTEEPFLRALSIAGEKAGCTVVVFSSWNISYRKRTLVGYLFDRARMRWQRRRVPWPKVIYNRCLPPHTHSAPARAALLHFLRVSRAHLLQRPTPGKWRMHQVLRRHPQFLRLVPRSARLRSFAQLTRRLIQPGALILKPIAGSHGRGILRLMKHHDGTIEMHGRDARNQIVTERFAGTSSDKNTSHPLRQRLRTIIGGRSYLLQQSLNLMTRANEPFDVRAFTQKDRHGEWRLRGAAVRIGERGGLTANLAGGARAHPAQAALAEQFGKRRAHSLFQDIQHHSIHLARMIERTFGRHFELGFDFGITSDGELYLLEVNGKPGRDIFLRSHQTDVYTAAVHGVIEAWRAPRTH